MINKVILLGNLGRDPELRQTTEGTQVANFSIATSRKWKDRDGDSYEETEWHNIVVFGRQAEIAGQYLRRGRQVFLEGRIQTRSWDDKNTGEKKYRTEIICENFQMLGGKGESGGQERGQGGRGRGRQRRPQGPPQQRQQTGPEQASFEPEGKQDDPPW